MNYLTEIEYGKKVSELTEEERTQFDAWRVELWEPYTPEPLDEQDLSTPNGRVQLQEVAKAFGGL